jgi:hypothetical protein
LNREHEEAGTPHNLTQPHKTVTRLQKHKLLLLQDAHHEIQKAPSACSFLAPPMLLLPLTPTHAAAVDKLAVSSAVGKEGAKG